MTPKEAIKVIQKFAYDESGFGIIKGCYSALDVIETYIWTERPPRSGNDIYGALFWMSMQLGWKRTFIPMNFINRWRMKAFEDAMQELMNKWRDLDEQVTF